jgi:hypothetical protein
MKSVHELFSVDITAGLNMRLHINFTLFTGNSVPSVTAC